MLLSRLSGKRSPTLERVSSRPEIRYADFARPVARSLGQPMNGTTDFECEPGDSISANYTRISSESEARYNRITQIKTCCPIMLHHAILQYAPRALIMNGN
jgi:hypothetical protein